jgi:hypothetical protein
MIESYTPKIYVVIGFFAGRENYFSVDYGFVLDLFSEKFV